MAERIPFRRDHRNRIPVAGDVLVYVWLKTDPPRYDPTGLKPQRADRYRWTERSEIVAYMVAPAVFQQEGGEHV
jgi:hypothetical protein